MKTAYIVKGYRTAVGKSGRGGFRFKRADELAAETIAHLVNELPDFDKKRIDDVIERASEPQRMQVLHDLCTMSQAEGGVTEAERAELDTIARGLKIPTSFICQSLDNIKELD